MLINMLQLQAHGDERGLLISLEKGRNIPFEIKRVYYSFGTKGGVVRGLHAHKKLKQLVVVVKGSCRFVLDDGKERVDVILDNPAQALYLNSNVWREIHDITEDCVCMVLADEVYDESDYIRSYDDFLLYVNDMETVKVEEIVND